MTALNQARSTQPNQLEFEGRVITDPIQIAFVQRLKALEDKQISVKDLPMKQLESRLFVNAAPRDPNDTLEPHSIGAGLLSGVFTSVSGANYEVAVGAFNAEWGGVFGFTNVVTVEHGLRNAPVVMFANSGSTTVVSYGSARIQPSTENKKMEVYAVATTGIPAAGTPTVIHWAAIALA